MPASKSASKSTFKPASQASESLSGKKYRVKFCYSQTYLTFDMGQKAPFEELLRLVRTKLHHPTGSLCFRFVGKRVEPDDTPSSLGMDLEEVNIIDITKMLYQVEISYLYQKITFRMPPGSTFRDAFQTFCRRINKEQAGLRFNFEERRIQDYDTPESLHMAEDDINIVEVHLEQIGG